MPAKSQAQRRFMYAMLEQQKKTGHNKTGMSTGQLEDYTTKDHSKGLPEHKGAKRKHLTG